MTLYIINAVMMSGGMEFKNGEDISLYMILHTTLFFLLQYFIILDGQRIPSLFDYMYLWRVHPILWAMFPWSQGEAIHVRSSQVDDKVVGKCNVDLTRSIVVATLYGIFIGPLGVGLIDLEGWDGKHELTREFSRIAIGIQVMVVGITLPKKYLIKEARSLSILLVLVMSSMWIVSALCVWLMFPNLTFVSLSLDVYYMSMIANVAIVGQTQSWKRL